MMRFAILPQSMGTDLPIPLAKNHSTRLSDSGKGESNHCPNVSSSPPSPPHDSSVLLWGRGLDINFNVHDASRFFKQRKVRFNVGFVLQVPNHL